MNKAADKSMSYDELRGAIAQRHRALSGRLQQIAEFVLDHPTDVALGTVAEIAERFRDSDSPRPSSPMSGRRSS